MRSTSISKVLREILVEANLDENQECRLKNGVKRKDVSTSEIVDPNPVWYKYDSKGRLHAYCPPKAAI